MLWIRWSKQLSVSLFTLALFTFQTLPAVTLAPGEVLAPDSEQVITIPVQGDIWTLEPEQANNFWSRMILDMVIEPLVRFKAERGVAPAGATHWEHRENKTVWIFHLRKAAKWSNGDPVTAQDFVRTYQNYCDPEIRTHIDPVFFEAFPLKNAWAIFFEGLPVETLGVKALDDYTLELTFEKPVQEKPLFTLLAHPMFAPMHLRFLGAIREIDRQIDTVSYRHRHRYTTAYGEPRRYLKDELTQEEEAAFTGNAFISNGPFRLIDWRSRCVVKAEKNPYYWDTENVALQKINWEFTQFEPRDFWRVAVQKDRWNMADVTNGPYCPKDWQAAVFEKWGGQYVAPSTQRTEMITLNTRCKKLQNHQVRKALDCLLNREGFVGKQLEQTPGGYKRNPKKEISYSLVPPRSNYQPEYQPSFAGLESTERCAMGEALLREAGYSDEHPLELTLAVSNLRKGFYETFESFDIGLFESPLIKLQIEVIDACEVEEKLAAGDFEMFLAQRIFLGEVPEGIFESCMSSKPLGIYTGLRNHDYDKLMEQLRLSDAHRCLDEAQRYALLRQAEQLLMEQHVLLVLRHPRSAFVVKQNIRGLLEGEHPLGYPDLRYVYIISQNRGQSDDRPAVARKVIVTDRGSIVLYSLAVRAAK